MKKKIHLKQKKKTILKKRNCLFMTIILVGLTVYFLLCIIGNYFTPILIETAEMEVSKFSTIIVNKAISQVLDDKINVDEIFETVKSKDGKIQTVDFNPVVVNQVLNVAVTVVQDNLMLLENGDLNSIGIYDLNLSEERIKDLEKGIVVRIPIGVVTKNTILANLGPEIPIRLHFIGDVNSNITTEITQYGINNAMVEVGVRLEMSAQIILPFTTKKQTLNYDIPLAIKIIQGNVPNYYGNGLLKESSLYSIPLED